MTSNSSQMAVAPASTPPEILLFLHRNRSAAASMSAGTLEQSRQQTNESIACCQTKQKIKGLGVSHASSQLQPINMRLLQDHTVIL
jgi:hypothetical protein